MRGTMGPYVSFVVVLSLLCCHYWCFCFLCYLFGLCVQPLFSAELRGQVSCVDCLFVDCCFSMCSVCVLCVVCCAGIRAGQSPRFGASRRRCRHGHQGRCIVCACVFIIHCVHCGCSVHTHRANRTSTSKATWSAALSRGGCVLLLCMDRFALVSVTVCACCCLWLSFMCCSSCCCCSIDPQDYAMVKEADAEPVPKGVKVCLCVYVYLLRY